ncbi:MAG: oligopeptide transporter, OPT family [Candidatus Solibacter usitatus]|nr:oligopeptide transporter, OPT family [Candidatus Solibacter usitatus]
MSENKHRPFVPEDMKMQEFTLRAVILGIAMTLVLGMANAYLGLKAGITIAATYPAAVVSMAVLRRMKGTILEENLARTAGSIGESVAAGAIFTLPAFVMSRSWASFDPKDAYWKSTALMVIGSFLGVLFVSLVRRVMVEDPELPFPESVAAAEIHKAGQRGGAAAKFLFYNMGLGALLQLLAEFRVFLPDRDFLMRVGSIGSSFVRLGAAQNAPRVSTGGLTMMSAPTISPAYVGVGYIIGPKLASLNFAGGVLAWGLMVPLLLYFLGPQLQATLPAGSGEDAWEGLATSVWRFIVRPIAVGGMLVGAAYTLFRMRKNLAAGLGKAFAELRADGAAAPEAKRTEQYMKSKTVFGMIAVVFALMTVLYIYLAGGVGAGILAAVVMLLVGFFFATISGYLVGVIGSTNNPISGLTLSTLIIAALLLVTIGVSGTGGVVAVLGVAAVVCVSSAVAGELLQDFKVGYLLGGTPRTIQIVELIAVTVAALVMYFPLLMLHEGNKADGGIGFGDRRLAAPQAGLMAMLAQGIVGGEMAWPLVGVGILMGIAMIMVQVRSPMLVAVGMYLPVATTFAIFVGGLIRWVTDTLAERRGYNEAQRARVENVGILAASGLIAGEAMVGLVKATYNFAKGPIEPLLANPSYWAGLVALAIIVVALVRTPLANAGRPDEPAPPAAMM